MKKIIMLIACLITLTIFIMTVTIVFKNENRNAKVVEIDPLLSDTVMLENLSADKSNKSTEKLVALSSRKDAIGYYACVELGDRLPAKDGAGYFKKALELYDSRDIKIRLASCYVELGNLMEAAKTFADVLPDDIALDSLTMLDIDADVIAQVLIDSGNTSTAADYLKAQIETAQDSDIKTKLKRLYGICLVNLGRYNEALVIFEDPSICNTRDSDLLWYYARALEASGNTNRAKELYKSLGEMGAYRLGLILEKEGMLNDAAQAYIQSPNAESKWKGAHILDEMGKRSKALEVYLSISSQQGTYQDDAAFRAYVLSKKIKSGEESELLSVFSNRPSWMLRLDKQPILPEITQISYGKPKFLTMMEAYEKSGRTEMAQIELSIGEKNATLEEKLALGDWYMSNGDLYQAVRWGIRAVNESPDRHGYELAYQRPYMEEVRAAAAEFEMDENLIWSVMRAESSFQKDAVSRAGAMGLMQIMPDTGKYLASKLKVSFSEKDLLNPVINIRLGTYYLKYLLDLYSGDLDKALAAYNGGAGNVKKWSNSGIGSTKQDFPTAISFLETREYITRIQDAYYIYQMLYSDNNK